MNFKKIFFVFEIPPLNIYYTRYDMRLLMEKGYRVEVLDLSPVLHPAAYSQRKEGLLDGSHNMVVYHIMSKKELRELLKQQREAFFWLTLPVYSGSYPLLKEISRHHYGFACNVDYVPPTPIQQRMQSVNFWTQWSWNRIREALFARIPRRLMPVKKADAVVTFTEDRLGEMLNNTLWNHNTKILLTNTLDYNECLQVKKKETRLIKEEYCLFIDQFLPLHPDGKEAGIHINADAYYNEIVTFLNCVKGITGKKVVIAGHPRGNYALCAQYFKEFEVFQFCTCELVKDAVMVMSHSSISLSFVVIYQKPLLLLSTDDMERTEILKNGLISAGISTQHRVINISKIDSKEMVYDIIEEEMSKDGTDYAKQRRCYCLDEHHENKELQFGEVLVKAMQGTDRSL